MRSILTDNRIPFPYLHRMMWSGISIADAFRPYLSPGLRLAARYSFDGRYDHARLAALHAIECHASPPHDPIFPLQTAPCLGTWPEEASAYAAIGLSCFVEIHELHSYLAVDCLAHEKKLDELANESGVDHERICEIVAMTARAIEARIHVTLLACRPGLESLACYRTFVAAQQNMQFRTMKEIVEAVTLFGDLLPPTSHLPLRQATRNIIRDMLHVSSPYLHRLHEIDVDSAINLAEEWTFLLSRVLLRHLRKSDRQEEQQPRMQEDTLLIPPLHHPLLPNFMGGNPTIEELSQSKDCRHMDGNFSISEYIEALSSAIHPGPKTAFGSPEQFSTLLRDSSFARRSSDETVPAETAFLFLRMQHPSYEKQVKVEILTARDDITDEMVRTLDEDAQPLARELTRLLYRDRDRPYLYQRRLGGGSIDPTRIASAMISDAVYRRRAIQTQCTKSGKPLIAIAGDASGSLSRKQAAMIQLLMTAWMKAIRGHHLQMLAALYTGVQQDSGGAVRPLIQWVRHPRLTALRSVHDAVRALAGFTGGVGVQADAISIQHIAVSAKKLERGILFLVLITDAVWRKSDPAHESALYEMRSTLEEIRRRYRDGIHITLVVVGNRRSGIEDLIDASLHVRNEELEDRTAVTGKISSYVAHMLKQHRTYI